MQYKVIQGQGSRGQNEDGNASKAKDLSPKPGTLKCFLEAPPGHGLVLKGSITDYFDMLLTDHNQHIQVFKKTRSFFNCTWCNLLVTLTVKNKYKAKHTENNSFSIILIMHLVSICRNKHAENDQIIETNE